jgi:D-alanyl-D-alanine carboxypeptidase/D-alanyl-D-alanine-endopeptidase (penicillin-binding protein 4)
VGRKAFVPAFWGIEVRSLRNGRVIYALNAEKNLRPASSLKLVTTAAALHVLGEAAALRTTVETAGRLDVFGRILGDVYLVGRGDPDLSGRFAAGRATAPLEELANGLWASGVRRIEGRLVGHEGAFTGERRGSDWGWEDLVWSYGAEVSALSFNDNGATLRLLPGEQPGEPAILEREPASRHYEAQSSAITGPPGSTTELTLTEPTANTFLLTGQIALGEKPWEGTVAIANPALYAVTVFADVLQAKGISLPGGVATSSETLSGGLRVLAAHESPPLAEMLKVVNKESQNLHAEMLLRLVGQKAKGQGSVEAGQAAVLDFLSEIGLVRESFSLQDGSGLSRSDLVTAHGLTGLLAAMDRHPRAAAFRASLAIGGRDGTLKGRLKDTGGRVLAKTGTLREANALAGYATAADGDRLAFSILVNNHGLPGREAVAAIDEIVGVLLR